GDVQAAATQGLMDLGDAAVFGVTEAADGGDHIESELMLGQSVEALGLGPVRFAVAVAAAVVATVDIQQQADESGERGDGTSIPVVGPQALAARDAMGKPWAQVLGTSGLGSRRLTGHSYLQIEEPETPPHSMLHCPVSFAALEKNGYEGAGVVCPQCAQSAKFHGCRDKAALSMLGSVACQRAYYYCG